MFGCSGFPCPSRTVALTRTGTVYVCGFDFGAAGIPLLDLRFAHDILVFAAAARMVDASVTCLEGVGVAPKASKTCRLHAASQTFYANK